MTEQKTRLKEWIFVTHEYAPFHGGVATYVAETAAALSRMDERVSVWAPDYGRKALKENPDKDSAIVERLPAGGSLRVAHLWQFGRAIWRRRKELVSKHLVLGSVGAHLVFFFLMETGGVSCRHLTSILHGSEILRFQQNFLWRWLARRFYRRVDQVVTVSQFSRELLNKSFLAEQTRNVRIAPGAVSRAAESPVIADFRADGKLVILTLARIHPRKGQWETARALAALPPDLRARIVYQIGGVGDKKYLAAVAAVCRQAEIAFEYLGEIAPVNLAYSYAQCDIFIMTSRILPRSVEGFGISYLEAGYHGKPVVAFRSGGTAEAVRDGETGLLAEAGNLAEVTASLEQLIRQPDLRKKLGQAGRRWAARFEWEKSARIIAGERE